MANYSYHIFVCINQRTPDDPRGSCSARGSIALQEHFKAEVKKRGLKGTVRANKSGCLDHCALGPSVVIYPEGIWYTIRSIEDVNEIMDRHIGHGEVIDHLRMGRSNEK